jgi:hypothetical protein
VGSDSLETKHCTKCKEEKAISEFYADASRRGGFYQRCKLCVKAGNVKRYHNGAALSQVLATAKCRAGKQGVPFNLTLTNIPPVPTHCPALGIELRRGGVRDRANAPSLDRIIPELGYVTDNVIWVSMLANQIKTYATPEQIIRVGTFYQQLIGGSNDRNGCH